MIRSCPVRHSTPNGLFAASAVMMGWLGKNTLAAHSIALEITALFFMVHLGLSNAATVMVGRARGRGDVAALRSGALAAVVLSLGFALATIFVYWIFAEQMVGLFLKPDDPERAAIIPLGVTLLMVAALFQFADSGRSWPWACCAASRTPSSRWSLPPFPTGWWACPAATGWASCWAGRGSGSGWGWSWG